MKIKFEKGLKNIPEGFELPIIPNAITYVVGLNGSGKTVTFSTLVNFLNKKLKKKGNWMTPPPDYMMKGFSFEGFDDITDVWHYTAKTRQSMWVDLDLTMESAAGIGSLHSSEGINCQAEIVAMAKKKNEEKTLFIFDEIDGNLDVRAKHIFFDHVLPTIKGTSIVMSHDPWFLIDKQVFDFSSGTYMLYQEYMRKYTKLSFTKE